PGYYPVDITGAYAGFVTPAGKTGAIGFGWSNFVSKSLYTENIFVFGWARSTDGLINLDENEQIYMGLNLKYMSFSFDGDLYNASLFNKYGNSVSGLTLDFGINYEPSEKFRFALTGKNIYPMNTGLVTREIIPAEFNLGTMYSIKKAGFIDEIKIAAQLGARSAGTSGGIMPAGGIEAISSRTFAVRLGLNPSEAGLGLGSGILKGLEVNFSFLVPYKMQGSPVSFRTGTVFYW
ncbi:MAG: hypothetical protein AB1633_08145, partial [Elusimicrobiota bacterium]